jgi:hypothetical protein
MIVIVAKSLLMSPFEGLLCEPVSIAVGLAPKPNPISSCSPKRTLRRLIGRLRFLVIYAIISE